MTLWCPDCGIKGRLSAELDEDDDLVGYECDCCHALFDEPSEEEPDQ